MAGVTLNRTYDPHVREGSGIIKRGGGGGQGPISLHMTMGNMNDRKTVAPPTYGPTNYLRRFFENVAGLLGFIAPTEMRQTLNRSDTATLPASPIPHDRRWTSSTYRKPWYPWLWALYIPQNLYGTSRSQVPQVIEQGATMNSPHPNMLTFYRRYPPYSTQTKVLSRG